jgi:preprotein translocase subunit SecG
MERGNTGKFVTGELQNESGNTSSVTNEEDIEIVSEPFETTCTIVENRSHKKPSKSILDDVKLFQDAVARKKMTRWIMILVGLFIVTGGILLIVTLNMSEDIDNKGKRVHKNINIEFSAHDAFLE